MVFIIYHLMKDYATFFFPIWLNCQLRTQVYSLVYGWQGIKTVERAIIKKEENKKTKTTKYSLLVEGLVYFSFSLYLSNYLWYLHIIFLPICIIAAPLLILVLLQIMYLFIYVCLDWAEGFSQFTYQNIRENFTYCPWSFIIFSIILLKL